MSALSFLILDDSENERRIMANVLVDAFPRADIHQTGDAAEAIEMCNQLPLECVLLDYHMPQMDGLEFAGHVRPKRPHLPLVLVTGVGDEMLVSHAMRGGISDYIPKGRVTVDSIQRTVERAIQSCAQTRLIEEQRSELENFAYALAHDFKQPIRQIRTFSSLISAELGGGGDEAIQRHLAFLNQAARRLSDLVDVMSQYTLLSERVELQTVDFSAVVAGARGALEPLLEERGAELVVCGEATFRGNATLMEQVLQNLILNGIKYNKSAAPCVRVQASVAAAVCTIAVSDNGVGIAPQYLDEIFRPLIRLHTAAEYAGTGLGLTLARKAVTMQGGSIWCESEPGAGSTFFVKLSAAVEGQR